MVQLKFSFSGNFLMATTKCLTFYERLITVSTKKSHLEVAILWLPLIIYHLVSTTLSLPLVKFLLELNMATTTYHNIVITLFVAAIKAIHFMSTYYSPLKL